MKIASDRYHTQARARAKRWRAINQLRHRIYSRDYAARQYALDPERSRATSRAWLKAHPNRAHANARNGKARRRARIASVLATLTAAEWEAILEAAGHSCIYCGSQKQITQDHLMPISRGGAHTAENIAPACLPCNQSKGVQVVADFLAER